MFEVAHKKRSEKHISDPLNKSAAKRLHMFFTMDGTSLRARCGFWPLDINQPGSLSCPLDVHTGNVAVNKAIKRRTNDIRTLMELD